MLKDISLGVELSEYMQDLLEYGLGKYDVDFYGFDEKEKFQLWKPYRKEQVQQLLLNNPGDIMKGTKIYDDIAYTFVTVIKDNATNEALKYSDGYIDTHTFQWETVARITDKELNALKHCKKMQAFVRKTDKEDGILLPFTYVGSGTMEYIEGSKKENGAHLFHVRMDHETPEDLYFDFKLPPEMKE